MVRTYSLKTDGTKPLARNFLCREFACHDGSDNLLVDDALPVLLQKLRDHFRAPVTVNSGYRTPAHNKAVGGVDNSQHVQGTAADIAVQGVEPLAVAQYAEHLMPDRGGIGLYGGFVHVDVRQGRGRWDSRSGKEATVAGFPGCTAPWYQEHLDWALAVGVTADGARPDEPCTRAEIWAMLHRMSESGEAV